MAHTDGTLLNTLDSFIYGFTIDGSIWVLYKGLLFLPTSHRPPSFYANS